MKTYPRYKDSGVEWLGVVPEHWPLNRVKYATLINADVLSESTAADFEFEYIDIGNVSFEAGIQQTQRFRFENAPSRARRIVRVGDVIVSTVRTYLKAIASIGEAFANAIVSTGFCVIRPKASELQSPYCAYLMKSNYFVETVVSISTGVSYPATNSSDIAALRMPLPPLPEQRAIAAYLDRETAKIDTLIAKQEQLIALLEEKRQALISHAVTKGLDPNVKMKDSGVEWLGQVPAHWATIQLGQVCSKTIDNRGRSPAYQESGYPILEADNINSGEIHPTEDISKFISLTDSKMYVREHLRQGDVLIITVGATAGKCAIVPETFNYVILQNMVGFRCAENMAPLFLYFLMSSFGFRSELLSLNKSNTIDNLKVSVFIKIRIPLPERDEQQRITEYLTRQTGMFGQLMKNARNVITLLKEKRSALISAAVTGKIDVRDQVPT
jgi:type I restriction enzyme S subunit